jgi:chorismate mutase/prephenate dehydratase
MKQNQQQTKPTILIIGGSGRMGKWFQSFFESNNVRVLIYGRASKKSLTKLLGKADIVIVSVPISQTERIIKSLIPNLRSDQLLCDIASLKDISLKTMKDAPCGTLGMHPLFGPSILSPQGQKIVFCHQHDNDHVSFLKELFLQSGMEIIDLKASEHDQQMAVIQALIHAVNIALAKTLDNQLSINSKLQTPLFTLQSLVTSRVLQQEPHLITDIQLLNPHFLPIIKELQQSINLLVDINIKKDWQGFTNLLKSLRRKTEQIAPYTLYKTNKILTMIDDKPITLSSSSIQINQNSSLKVAYLGPEGTNTHQAAMKVFDNQKNIFVAKEIIDDIFQAVNEENADAGIVPAENSLHGTVRETLDILSNSPLKVIGSFTLPIHHYLLSIEKDFKKIKTVVSHPQALAQCKNWLTKHLPGVKIITTTSTTASLNNPKKYEAYIASEKASKIYNVPILAKNIEDNTTNLTRFYVIAKKDLQIEGLKQNNTLIFLTIFNRVGILRDILDIFARKGISLTKLESRPSLEKVWDYCFYIEVDHKEENKKLKRALTEIQKYCSTVRILGRT